MSLLWICLQSLFSDIFKNRVLRVIINVLSDQFTIFPLSSQNLYIIYYTSY